ncbi:MAG: helix-turn-helix domain-containing protein [Acidimicrobiales bacterium]
MTEGEEIPELPFEIDVGRIAMIHQDWWDENPEALNEAMNIAEWLDFHIDQRTAGESGSDRPVQRLTLTVEQAAETLGISRAFAYEAVANGDIPCIRIGRRILVPKAALEKLLNGAG